MAKYTHELIEIGSFEELFTFDYDFYDLTVCANFEEKFFDEYAFSEIGFPDFEKFKYRLRTRLNKIMPYYHQLYATELEAKNINFLLNKDLKETFFREATKAENIGTTTNNDTTSNSVDVVTDVTDYKESNIADGVSSVALEVGDLTSVNNTDNKHDSSNDTIVENLVVSDLDRDVQDKEFTELISKGNIGTTSSATLLDMWRDVLLNIDRLIIEECADLFMGVF